MSNKWCWDFEKAGIFISLPYGFSMFSRRLGKTWNKWCWGQGNKTCWDFKTPRKSAFKSIPKHFSCVFLYKGIPTIMDAHIASPYFCTCFSILLHPKSGVRKNVFPPREPWPAIPLTLQEQQAAHWIDTTTGLSLCWCGPLIWRDVVAVAIT